MECSDCGYKYGPFDTECLRCAQSVFEVAPDQPAIPIVPDPLTCSQCGLLIPTPRTYCPNCGASLSSQTSWPPEPKNQSLPFAQKRKELITGHVGGDIALGFFGTLFSPIAAGIGVFIVPVIAILFRTRYPYFVLGIRYASIAAAVAITCIVLGVLYTCSTQRSSF